MLKRFIYLGIIGGTVGFFAGRYLSFSFLAEFFAIVLLCGGAGFFYDELNKIIIF